MYIRLTTERSMACGNYTGGEKSLEANSGELQYVWFTTWFLAVGIDKLRAVIKNRGVVGNFQSQVAYQVAEVRTDVPGTPTAVANTIKTGAGELNTEDVNIASATGPVFFVRFGVAYKISSGATPSRADVSLEVSFDQCGKSVGARSFTVSTDLGSGSKITVPITDFFPAISADKLKCAIIVSGASSDFRCELAYRPAATSKQSPGSWNSSFTPAGPTYSGNTEDCTEELAPSSAVTAMWMQVGLSYWSNTGGTLAQATIEVASAIRRA